MRYQNRHKVCKDQRESFHMLINFFCEIQISCQDQLQYAQQVYHILYIITREHRHIILVMHQSYPKAPFQPQ